MLAGGAGAGAGCKIYKDWAPFLAAEICQHLGLYILNGLSPSPRVEYKNWPQREDFVHGSDLMCHAFSGSAEWRHIQLRAFFIHNLAIYPPSQKHCPN
jgi:hypothetical protein